MVRVAAVAAAVGSGSWVEFVDGSGRDHSVALIDCAAARFEDALPVRGFASFRGQRNFPGFWWSATTGSHVGYESWVERDWLTAFDSSPEIVGIASQPMRLSWKVAGRTRRHTPDYFLRMRDGGAVVADVRPDDRIDAEDAAAFERTAQACREIGWDYRRIGEMPRTQAANLRWLSGYRHPRCRRGGLSEQLREAFTTPIPLAVGAMAVGEPVGVLPTLFHLLWRHELRADIDGALLGPDTIVEGGT